MADVKETLAELQPFFADHLRRYLANGSDGHIIDTSPYGGSKSTTTLLLKTIGRRSGRNLVTPLIYDRIGAEYAIVASKAGADEHPAWYLNLTAKAEARFQVAEQRFTGTWRLAEGDERASAWAQMTAFYPTYATYQSLTAREIPIVLLKAERTVGNL
jgi:deazaflavin-dependent oxidoreductase (nitroreductase family)